MPDQNNLTNNFLRVNISFSTVPVHCCFFQGEIIVSREKPIPVIVPKHLKGVVPAKEAVTILRKSRERNALNKEHIAHITLQEVTHPNGSVGLVPVVVAKPPPSNMYRATAWPRIPQPRKLYFTD